MTEDQKRSIAAKNPAYAKLWKLQEMQGLMYQSPSSKPLPDIRRCIHLGDRIPGQPCGSPLSVCKLHNDVTSTLYPCVAAKRCCNGCKDRRIIHPFVSKPSDPLVGVAIGSFRWPELVDLQCHVIRETCGPAPILVSNDDPEGHDALAAICAKHHDVTLDTNPERIGHTGGDIAVFSKAVRWGTDRGLDAVAKLSQRFIVARSRWLHDSAADLLASGLPMASRRCRGNAPFDLRTEAVLIDVGQWGRPEVLERIKPRRYWTDAPNGLCAETIIFRLLNDLLGGVFWPWASLMGEDRYKRDAKDILWHCNTTRREYRNLASDYGVTMSEALHIGGWEQEQKEGRYHYG